MSAFDKFFEQFNESALKPALLAAQDKLDELLGRLPADELARQLEDILSQQQNANPLASGLPVDTAQIEAAVESLKARLQDEQTSLQIAKGIKLLLDNTSTDTIESAFSSLASRGNPEQAFVAQILFSQLGPQLDDLRDASAEAVAAQIRFFAEELNGADIASQLTLLVEQSAQKLPTQKPDLSAQINPQDVADVVQDLGDAARNALQNAATGNSLEETLGALKQFQANAAIILAKLNPNDNTPPFTPPKKPKGPNKRNDKFDL
jgi:hypothetical protein